MSINSHYQISQIKENLKWLAEVCFVRAQHEQDLFRNSCIGAASHFSYLTISAKAVPKGLTW